MASSIFIIAQIAPSWQKPLLSTLLAVSVILWLIWLFRVLIRRRLLPGTSQIQQRPHFVQVGIAFLSLLLLVPLWVWLLRGALDAPKLDLALAGALAELCACLLILAMLGWMSPNRLASFGLSFKAWPRHLVWGLICALAVWPIATRLILPLSLQAVQFLSRWLWNLAYTPQPHILIREISETTSAINLCLVGVLVVLIAPLTEEIIFRGLLQGALVRSLHSRRTAIAISAAIFSILHVAVRETVPVGEASLTYVEAIPSLFLLALVLGYSYEKSGSLSRPIFIHMAFNAFSLFMAWPQLS